jgi:hypothetical protein
MIFPKQTIICPYRSITDDKSAFSDAPDLHAGMAAIGSDCVKTQNVKFSRDFYHKNLP